MNAAQKTGPLSVVVRSYAGQYAITNDHMNCKGPWSEIYVEFGGYFGAHGPQVFAAAPDLLAELKKARAFIEVDRNDLLGSLTVNDELKADDIDLRAIAEYNDMLASIDAAMTKAGAA
jgi:hypothetical protein